MKTEKRARPNRLELTHVWPYYDENNRFIFEKLRYRTDGPRGKDYAYRRPISWDESGRLRQSRKPENADDYLYRLPELLLAVKRGGSVYWTEGERDADELATFGVTTTSHHGGAGKISPQQCEWFKGFAGRVYLVLDNDIAGAHDGKLRWLGLVNHAGLSPSQLTFLAPQQDCKDARDHLAAGYGRVGFLRVNRHRVFDLAAKWSKKTAQKSGYRWWE